MPAISVIVPVYKAEAYLESCIQSVLNQSFPDWELILVEDGSPDCCGALCDAYAQRDSRIRALHQSNQGQAAARNQGLSIARGDWVSFVDSDDLIHPQMLQRLYQAVSESGAPVSMCRMLEAAQLPESFFSVDEPSWETLTMDEKTLAALYDRDEYPGWVACAKLIRRELILSYPFREGRVYEDNEAVCRWLYQAGRLARLPDRLYFYRTNPESTTKAAYSLKQLDYLWALESILSFWGQVGYASMRERFAERYVQAVAGAIRGTRQILNRPDIARKVERSARRFLKREGISLTKPQFELLLDTAHPRLICWYWPLEGCLRTFREKGVRALLGKIREQLRGERP